MPLTDTKGVAWAHSTTVKVGDKLRCDGGFTCMEAGAVKEVKRNDGDLSKTHDAEYAKDPFARLYIDCEDGQHTLDGQVGEDGELDGLYPCP